MAVTRLKPLYDQAGKLKGYVDKYTGEEFGFPVIVGRKRNPYGKGWVMNSQEALEILAKDKEITGEAYRVLFFICARLDFENWVQVPVTEIAQELDLRQPNVSRAMKVLEDKQIILRGPKVGRSYAFMLNPEFGWKGKVTNLEDYRRQEWDKRSRKLKAVASSEETPQTYPSQTVKKVIEHSPEINQLSQQFDIPTEKLEKLLSYFQSIQDSPV
ncbi:MAG: MarR family transcriptional regulator [Hydrococcus sp. RM1_1_31]|nr:MarR family transcriptional regulator [Hydrococcus sp. RM1_1_31]